MKAFIILYTINYCPGSVDVPLPPVSDVICPGSVDVPLPPTSNVNCPESVDVPLTPISDVICPGSVDVPLPPISLGELKDVNTIIKENNPIIKNDFFIIS